MEVISSNIAPSHFVSSWLPFYTTPSTIIIGQNWKSSVSLTLH